MQKGEGCEEKNEKLLTRARVRVRFYALGSRYLDPAASNFTILLVNESTSLQRTIPRIYDFTKTSFPIISRINQIKAVFL